MDFITKVLTRNSNKNYKGLSNELLISGNLHKAGYTTKVLNDFNPSYDIKATKADKQYYIECKLDALVEHTNNFYFEYWNYTYNRPTGINNNDLETIYSHTYKIDGRYYHLIAKRKHFVKALKEVLKYEPTKVKIYNNTYYVNGKVTGDKAYIVDRNTFLRYFKGYNRQLNPSFRWN